MLVTPIETYPPGTAVELDDPDYGTWYGRVVVCLCKRHVWQPAIQGRECGHEHCGAPAAAEACLWPMHVVWENGNESHQGMDSLRVIEGASERHVAREAWHEAELLATAGYTWPVQEWQAPEEAPSERDVPWKSGEAAIYSPEYLEHREGNRRGAEPHLWRSLVN